MTKTQLGNPSPHFHFQAFILPVLLLHLVLWALEFNFSYFYSFLC